ncbi:MAG: peptide chain release factor N(5)-glutamine methyltransferase, partial [Saprospiraceae bacterium]
LPFKFDILVSNPPYIKSSEKELMSASTLKFEPEIALFAGDTGLDFYYRIAAFGLDHLNFDGRVFVEINESLGMKTMGIFQESGYYGIQLLKDLSGKDRFITCIKK